MEEVSELFQMIARELMDWPMGTLFAVLMIAVILIILCLILWGLFVAFDSWCLPRRRGRAVVRTKTYTPSRTTFVPQTIGKTTTLVPHYHPESFDLNLEVPSEAQSDTFSVSGNYYESVSIGDEIQVEYVVGRYSGSIYVKSII